MLVRVGRSGRGSLSSPARARPNRPTAPPPPPRARRIAAVASVAGTVPADRWRTVLVAGDNNSPAFDNGIDTLREQARGDAACATSRSYLRSGAAIRQARLASSANVINALRTPGGQACLVFITSHGDESGFFLRPDRRLCRRPRSTGR